MQEVEEVARLKSLWERLESEMNLNAYPIVCKEIKRLGLNTVYDIGCSYGPHIGYVLQQGLKYIGIDEDSSNELYDNRHLLIDYPVELRYGVQYPVKLHPKRSENACAVSICALGSLYNKDQIPRYMRALRKEFKHFFAESFSDSVWQMLPFWRHAEILECYSGAAVAHMWN